MLVELCTTRFTKEETREMEQIQLTSRTRTETGKGFMRRLRQQGLIPAILYGGTSGNIPLAVSSHDLLHILAKGAGEHSLIELLIEDAGESKSAQVIIKDYQVDPVMRTLLHADFLEVTMGQVLEIPVPIEIQGESPGVKTGGILEFITREILIECLPSKMLEHVVLDISALNIGDTLTVGDISLSSDYKILTASDVVIATISPPVVEKVVEVEEEEELVEPEVIQKGKKPEEEEEE
jgi:large subunit ribosomal protein L25